MNILSIVLLSSALGHPSTAAPAPKTASLQGRVHASSGGLGGRARVLLVTKDAEEFELHGATKPDHAELERLAGVTVELRGIRGDPRIPAGRHILVGDYSITDVGLGVVPELGTVARLMTDGGEQLLFVREDGQATLLPTGWARKMRRHVGAKIWMVGKRDGSTLKPTRFAILRAANR